MRNKKRRNTWRLPVGLIVLLAIFVSFSYWSPYLNRQTKKAVDAVENLSSAPSPIKTIIVPHHDLMKDDRAALFAKNKINPDTVILVSPNHFDTGKGDIISTTKDWKLSNSSIISDKDKVDQLVAAGAATNEEAAFNGEHGIANILSDISGNYPNAKIIPIIIRQDAARDRIENLNGTLAKICGKNCLLVASIDCSHYQPGSLAELHDSMTTRALNNLDEDLAWQSEVDSPQSLLLSILWSKYWGANKFHLDENTNSGKLSGSRDTESTSYVLGWFENGPANPKEENEFSFIFAGDMMFDRKVDYNFHDNKIYNIFDNFGQRVFWGTDLSFANLEGPISKTPIVADNSGSMVFNFPPTVPKLLNWLHLKSVSLANNHSSNAGAAGYDNTIKVLNDAGIVPVGHQEGYDAKSISRYQSGNVKVSIIAIDELATDADIKGDIAAEKKTGARVVISPHWGTEYETTHNGSQSLLAHRWIDAGADMVIGSHPHVIQDAEVYKGKPIFYSLGNFVFDQMFSTETQRGLIVAGKFTDTGIELVLLPTKEVNIQPQLLTGSEKDSFIAKYREFLGAPSQTGYGSDKIELSR